MPLPAKLKRHSKIGDNGWPVNYSAVFNSELATRLLLNSVACLLLILGTAVFVERQARRGRSDLRALAMQVAAACLVVALLLYVYWRGWRWEYFSGGEWYAIWPLSLIELPLAVAGLVISALGCTLHTAGWLFAGLIRRHGKRAD